MINSYQFLLSLSILFLFLTLIHSTTAFGAGNIPSFAYLEGSAFRHGDIEDTLANLFRKVRSLSDYQTLDE